MQSAMELELETEVLSTEQQTLAPAPSSDPATAPPVSARPSGSLPTPPPITIVPIGTPVGGGISRREINLSETSLDSDSAFRALENGDYKLSPAGSMRSLNSFVMNMDQSSFSAAALSETDARIVYVNYPGMNAKFCNNQVITSKYTKFSFIPRFLYARLSQTANFYFLLVGGGQCIPAISSTQSLPYQWCVLAVVLSIDAMFAAIEDRARHVADDKMNSRVAHQFDISEPNCFKDIMWKDVRVGSIIKVYNYEPVPADIVLLAVSEANPEEPAGICFVETKSLDGETNLKIRQALSCTYSQLADPKTLGDLPGRVIFEKPNHDVNNFTGRFEPQQGHTIPIDLKNVVLRGSVIRNTPYVYGLVLNTGRDTKIMQSMSETPQKQSTIMMLVNRGISILMTALIAFCVLGAVICALWVDNNYERALYLELDNLNGTAPFPNSVLGWFIYFGYYWILIASFVPITLYVTVALVKTYQTYFINRDLEIYDEVTDTPALVRNSDLNEDLGQITHVFSDKTGTLTANEMDFRKMSINGVSYGRGTTEIGRETVRRLGKEMSESDVLADQTPFESDTPNVHFLDPQNEFARDADANINSVQSQMIQNFFFHLAVCHSVVLEQNENSSTPTFSASSPDELALVSGAAFFGYSFVNRKNGSVTIRTKDGSEQVFEILEMIDFTSTRKRMSVVVRTPNGKIMLFTKGADVVLFERMLHTPENLQVVETTTQHLERFAIEGLRTLVIAQKELPEEAFMEWSREYNAVVSDLDQVAKQKAGEPNRIEELEEELEKNLQLLGATAIEDRLQDQVTSTIADLARARVKIWVLTGDKEETAINIGFACQLLSNDMDRLVINTDTFPTASALYDLLLTKSKEFRRIRKEGLAARPQAMIIDGKSLTMVFDYTAMRDLFLEVSQYCCSVICCRVSPKQKAQVVRLYKTNVNGCRSLAIGDGANDVGMIQEAHVGVGISGHEGMQAVNASDYAIAQFRFLKRLLFVHGHWNYRRMAKLALYVIYKNILLYTSCYVLAILPGGSGTLYYNNMWINGYNTFWTCLPIVVVGILEQDLSDKVAEKYPGLYFTGAQGEMFSIRILTEWIIEALYEGFVCAFVPYVFFGLVDSKNNSFSLNVCGGICYTVMICVSWMKLFLNTVSFNWVHFAANFYSMVYWFAGAYVISTMFPVSLADAAFPYIYELIEFYLILYVAILLCLMRDFLYKAYKREVHPEYYHVLQELHGQQQKDESRMQWVPPQLKFRPFEADLDQEKPEFETDKKTKHANHGRNRAYTGFAFSTQALEDRFLNPLREMALPVTQMVDMISRVFTAKDEDTEHVKTFEEKVKCLPTDDQVVYEIQRYQIFTGWGSTRPGHLFITDPPRFTNADMTDGSATFNLNDFVVDPSIGTLGDAWEYATKFKDFLRDRTVAAKSPKSRKRLKKKLNRLVGRCVRRRRWIRKDRTLSPCMSNDRLPISRSSSEVAMMVGTTQPAPDHPAKDRESSYSEVSEKQLPSGPPSPVHSTDETPTSFTRAPQQSRTSLSSSPAPPSATPPSI